MTIYLTPIDLLVDEVPVVGYKIRTILKRAEENIPKNYPADAFTMSAFYSQYHKENGKYVRLIESDLDVYHKPADSIGASVQKELVKINHIRRSINYEENKEQHGDHLIDLLSENPIRYVVGTVLNSKAFDFYTFKMEEQRLSPERKFYHLSFLSKPGLMKKTERGEIVINAETFAVTYIKIIEERNKNARADRHPYPGSYTCGFINGIYEMYFEEHEGRYYPLELFKSYLHELVNNNFHTVDYTVEENFHLFYNIKSYHEVKDASEKKEFNAVSNLYGMKYSYDKSFWNSFKTKEDHFPFTDISKDLSIHKALDEQYIEAGK